ncbi:MAG: YheU family protein [Motiliproteus sp.]|nr:YheU family protein [Motiliproteus sp.]MCW9051729.1 YheU family protein [Motiliproteus sp.]
MEIPYQQLSEEALQGLIEEYVTREGTDYGHANYSLADKVAAVLRQLQRGEAIIHFDSYMNTCNIIPKDQLNDMN